MHHRTRRAPLRRLAAAVAAAGLALAGLAALPASAAAQGGIGLEYRQSNGGSDQAEPWLRLTNTGGEPVSLSSLKVRYYFSSDGPGVGYRFACSWARIGCATVNGTFGTLGSPGADRYLEVGFTSGTLAPGADTGDLQLRFHRTDWQSMNQGDDYSFGAAQTRYGAWEKITVHRDGALVWGTAPDGADPADPADPSDPADPADPADPSDPTDPGGPPDQALFDDFDYAAHDDPRIGANGWIVKSGFGGPGVPGATWKPENITFPDVGGNSVMNLRSGTDGTAAGTEQTELYTSAMKFKEGTYASRVKFSDTPVFGPDGDRMVQTFFAINDLTAPMAPDYSEYDFEYLPNGGWGEPGNIMYATSWETYQENPWVADNTHTSDRSSFEGWHDLVFTIDDRRITYYIDGELFGVHDAYYLPERPMSINFNHWFIDLEGVHSGEARAYDQQVDYVYFAKDAVLTPAQVQAEVAAYRSSGVSFEDSVTP